MRIEFLETEPKRIFLVDAVGAFVSAVLLAGVLPLFQDWIGMPLLWLYGLGGIAAVFFGYSFWCHESPSRNPARLRGLIVGNLSYCVLTAGLVTYFSRSMTTAGLIYFIAEIVVILALVRLERSVLESGLS